MTFTIGQPSGMLYAFKRTDGSVWTLQLIPVAVCLPDKTVMPVDRIEEGKLICKSPTETGVVLKTEGPSATWSEGSIKDHELIFADPQSEIAKWGKYDQDTIVSIHKIGDLTSDRTFRDAWTCDDAGAISVDMTRARDIWRQRMRNARLDS